jgi:KDO2-lipid IV(A) lauroyltransferase
MKDLQQALVVGLFQCLAWLPLPLLRAGGRWVGRLLWLINSQTRRVVEENIAICFPEMAPAQRQQLARERLKQLAILALEMGPVWRRPAAEVEAMIHNIRGEELLEEAAAEGKGIVMLAPHIGNWEVIGVYLGRTFGVTIMFQPPSNPALNQMIKQARERSGSKLVPTNTSGVKTQLKVLKKGGMVGLLPDQVPPRGAGGEFASFFGVPALTMTLLCNLVQRTDCKVITAIALRNQQGGFDLQFMRPPEAIYSSDQGEALCALNQTVEQCVVLAPEQYQWEYKRFRKQPGGEKKYYRKHKQKA